MTKISVDKSKYTIYLKKAEEYKRSMEAAFEKEDWDACVGNSVHCAILASDALCTFMLGIRHKGDRHEEAVELFRSINSQDERIKKNSNRLGELLSIKTDAEYGDKFLTRRDSELATQAATRFFEFVKERISEFL